MKETTTEENDERGKLLIYNQGLMAMTGRSSDDDEGTTMNLEGSITVVMRRRMSVNVISDVETMRTAAAGSEDCS